MAGLVRLKQTGALALCCGFDLNKCERCHPFQGVSLRFQTNSCAVQLKYEHNMNQTHLKRTKKQDVMTQDGPKKRQNAQAQQVLLVIGVEVVITAIT